MAGPIEELFVKIGVRLDAQKFQAANKAVASLSNSFSSMARSAESGLNKLGASVKSAMGSIGKSLNQPLKIGGGGSDSTLDKLIGFAKVFAVYKLGQSVKDMALGLDQIGATAERLGVSVEALQELQFAAKRSDTDVESLNNGLKFLGRNVSDGGSSAAKALASIGIAAKDADGKVKPLDELFTQVATKFSKFGEGQEAKKLNLAQAIFGRGGGVELINLLNRGGDGIDKLRQRARDLGAVASADLVKSGEEFDDAWTEAGESLGGIFKKLAGPLIKPVTRILNLFLAAVTDPKNQAALKNIGSAFAVIAEAVVYLAGKFLSMNNLFGRMAALIGAGGLLYLITNLGTAFATMGTVLSPVLIPLATLALILDDVAVYLQGGDSMLGRFINKLDSIDTSGGGFLDFLTVAAQLVFDITDPAKWDRFFGIFEGWIDAATKKLYALISMLPGGKFLVSGGLGDMAAQALQSPGLSALANPGSAFVGGASSPSAAAAISSSAKGNRVNANTTINVSVGPGAEPNDIAQAVKDAIKQENERIFGDANASLIGGY